MRGLLSTIIFSIALTSSGCGVILQTAFGWYDERTERRTEKHSVAVGSVPGGAQISRRDPKGTETNIGQAPLSDQITYDVDVTIESPSAMGLLLGGLIETGAGIGLIVAGSGDSFGLSLIGIYTLVFAAGPELLTALIFGVSGDNVKTRKSVPESQSYFYTGRLTGLPDSTLPLKAPDQARLELVLDKSAQQQPAVVAEKKPADPQPVKNEPATQVGGTDKSWVIAVMDVEDINADRKEQAIDRGLVRNLGDQLRIFIAQHGAKTIDRSAQDRAIKDRIAAEKSESYKTCYDDSCQIELGKALAASHILRARITRFGKRCVLNTELIDLKAEVTMAASSAQGDCAAEGFLAMSEEVAKKLVGKSSR